MDPVDNNIIEEEFVSPATRSLRKKQAECIHPSWRCPVCHLYKDNICVRRSVIEECVTLIYANKDKDIPTILEKLVRLQNKML